MIAVKETPKPVKNITPSPNQSKFVIKPKNVNNPETAKPESKTDQPSKAESKVDSDAKKPSEPE